jgi:hypothetical protein
MSCVISMLSIGGVYTSSINQMFSKFTVTHKILRPICFALLSIDFNEEHTPLGGPGSWQSGYRLCAQLVVCVWWQLREQRLHCRRLEASEFVAGVFLCWAGGANKHWKGERKGRAHSNAWLRIVHVYAPVALALSCFSVNTSVIVLSRNS